MLPVPRTKSVAPEHPCQRGRSAAHSSNASSAGQSAVPHSVRRYSTLGGTSCARLRRHARVRAIAGSAFSARPPGWRVRAQKIVERNVRTTGKEPAFSAGLRESGMRPRRRSPPFMVSRRRAYLWVSTPPARSRPAIPAARLAAGPLQRWPDLGVAGAQPNFQYLRFGVWRR